MSKLRINTDFPYLGSVPIGIHKSWSQCISPSFLFRFFTAVEHVSKDVLTSVLCTGRVLCVSKRKSGYGKTECDSKIALGTYTVSLVLMDSTGVILCFRCLSLHFLVLTLPGIGSFFTLALARLSLIFSANFFLRSNNQSGSSGNVGVDGSAMYIGIRPRFIVFITHDK